MRKKLKIQKKFELKTAIAEAQDSDDDDINEFDFEDDPITLAPPVDPVEAVNEWVRYGRSNHNLPTINPHAEMPSTTTNVLEKLLARQSVPKDLPAFSGEPGEWQLFIRQYEHTTKMCGLTDEENAMRLAKCLKGKAHDAVCAMLGIPENVSLVMETLRMTFGRPDLIVKSLIQKAKGVPAPVESKPDTMIAFCNAVQSLVATMKNLRSTGHMKNPQLIEEFVQRLPCNFQMQWCMFIMEKPEYDLEDLGKWLKTVAAAACLMPCSMNSQDDPGPSPKPKDRNFKRNTLPTTPESKIPGACIKCKQPGHMLLTCPEFEKLEVDKKYKFLSERKICFCCLVPGHVSTRCPTKKECGTGGCKGSHHPILHKPKVDGAPAENFVGSSNASSRVLLKILPVKIEGPTGSLETFALIDDGATVSMIDSNVAQKIGLDGPTCPLHLQ